MLSMELSTNPKLNNLDSKVELPIDIKKFIEDNQKEGFISRKLLRLTDFGVLFLESVVRDRAESAEGNLRHQIG
jgi:hypothetical protein